MALLEDGSNSCATEDKIEEDVPPRKIRNRMQEQTLDSLLRIAIEGPPLNSFPVAEAVALWASKKQRRLYH